MQVIICFLIPSSELWGGGLWFKAALKHVWSRHHAWMVSYLQIMKPISHWTLCILKNAYFNCPVGSETSEREREQLQIMLLVSDDKWGSSCQIRGQPYAELFLHRHPNIWNNMEFISMIIYTSVCSLLSAQSDESRVVRSLSTVAIFESKWQHNCLHS